MSTFLKITAVEARLFCRDRAALILSLVLPVAILVVLGAIPMLRTPDENFGGMRFIDYFVPSLLVISIAMLGLSTLPSIITTYRERGVLRRMSATPVHPAMLLGAQLVVNIAAALASALLLMGVGAIGFDIAMPRHIGGFVLTFLLGITAVFAIGLIVAATAKTTRSANGLSSVLFMVTMFLSGVYLPRFMLPDAVNRIGDFTPPGVQGLLDTWNGQAPEPLPLVVMAVVALGALALSARLFRWE
ncbi:ABC-2 type transport system permease protein [Stackebrandtia albiflava]|uniref:Transport permease protein n=1 Tax=Stackebrandtia albiflava TaxID=406432 RepID=A0A562V9R7_9ACTN|nr:ABC transporter permease [Stackebrandtia albiflava]TWJ14624.1 ABC-2 type transport system permease protein [Stackebrandtia albiflava]